jgi:hypothetical protein
MQGLDHHELVCTGQWTLLGIGKQRTLRCSACTRQHPPTPENRELALGENYAGIWLRRLANEGSDLINVDLGDWKEGSH